MARTPKAPATPAAKPAAGVISVTPKQMAELFAIDERSVRRLAEKGVVTRSAERGKYELVSSVRAYTTHLRDMASGHADDQAGVSVVAENAMLKRIQRQAAEREALKEENKLLPIAEFEEVTASIIANIRAMVLAWPGALQAHLPHLTRHDIEKAKEVAHELLTESSIVKMEADKLPPPIGDRVRRPEEEY